MGYFKGLWEDLVWSGHTDRVKVIWTISYPCSWVWELGRAPDHTDNTNVI